MKEKEKEGPVQQAMKSDGERGWLNQPGTEMALGEGTDVTETWTGRFF